MPITQSWFLTGYRIEDDRTMQQQRELIDALRAFTMTGSRGSGSPSPASDEADRWERDLPMTLAQVAIVQLVSARTVRRRLTRAGLLNTKDASARYRRSEVEGAFASVPSATNRSTKRVRKPLAKVSAGRGAKVLAVDDENEETATVEARLLARLERASGDGKSPKLRLVTKEST